MRRLALVLALLAGPAAAQPATLTVTVTGVRSAKGQILVAVCDQATFLAEHCAFHGQVPAKPGSVAVTIGGLPPGVYAAQAFHDENANTRLDRSFLGLPEEGMGFSNDAKMRFGPPSFADAAFRIGPAGGTIQFGLRYFD